jgi:hypothetical protein
VVKRAFLTRLKLTDINDVLYYTLFVANQLDMQPDNTALFVSGTCPAGDFEKLNEFFKVVKYSDVKVIDVPMGVPAHQVLSIAALA